MIKWPYESYHDEITSSTNLCKLSDFKGLSTLGFDVDINKYTC